VLARSELKSVGMCITSIGQVVCAFDPGGEAAHFVQAGREASDPGVSKMTGEEFFYTAKTVLVAFEVEDLRKTICIEK